MREPADLLRLKQLIELQKVKYETQLHVIEGKIMQTTALDHLAQSTDLSELQRDQLILMTRLVDITIMVYLCEYALGERATFNLNEIDP
jgi:hypothetical protein